MLAFRATRLLVITTFAFALLALLSAANAHAAVNAVIANAPDSGAHSAAQDPVHANVMVVTAATPGEVFSRGYVLGLFDATHDTVRFVAGGGSIHLSANVPLPTGTHLVFDAAAGAEVSGVTTSGAGTLETTAMTNLLLNNATLASSIDAKGSASLIGTNTLSGAVKFAGPVVGPGSLVTASTSDVEFAGPVGSDPFGNGAPLASFTARGATKLGGNVRTSGALTFAGAVTINSDVTLGSTGGDLNITGTIDSTPAGARALTVMGTKVVAINANLGSTVPLKSFNVGSIGPDGLQLAGAITTVDSQNWYAPIVLTGDTTLTTRVTSNIVLSSTINGAHALTLNSSGFTQIAATIGGTTPLASLTTDATGSTNAAVMNNAMGTITTTGAQTYGDNFFPTNTVLNASDVTFDGTVGYAMQNGFDHLTINASGATTFHDSAQVAYLTTDAPGTTTLDSNVFGTDVTFGDDVTLTVDTFVQTTSHVTFNGSLDGAFRLTTGGFATAVAFNGSIGATTPLASLVLLGSNVPVTFGGSIVHVNGFIDAGHQFGGSGNAFIITGDVTFTSSGVVMLNATSIDGPGSLTLDSPQGAFITGPVGSSIPLSSFTTTRNTLFTMQGATLHTTGQQTYGWFANFSMAPILSIRSSNAGAQFQEGFGFGDFLGGTAPVFVSLDVATDSSAKTIGSSLTQTVMALRGSGRFSTTSGFGAKYPSMSIDNGTYRPLSIMGSQGQDISLTAPGRLEGDGNIGSITTIGGSISPGYFGPIGRFMVEHDVTLDADATYEVDIDPTGFSDNMTVQGNVSLGNAHLDLRGDASQLAPGVPVTVIFAGYPPNNSAVVGTFDGLAEGDLVLLHGIPLQISYVGGQSGHDVTLTRVRYTTATTLQVSNAVPMDIDTVTLTANVTATGLGAGIPAGTVRFFDDTTLIGTAATNAVGTATLIANPMSVGVHPITATFDQTITYDTSTSTVETVTVMPTTPTTPIEPPVQPAPAVTPPSQAPVVIPTLAIVNPYASTRCLAPNSTKLSFSISTTTAATVTYKLQRRAIGGHKNILTRCPRGTSGAKSGSTSFYTTRIIAKQFAKAGRHAVTLKQLLGKRPLIAGRYRLTVKAFNATTKKSDTVTFEFVVLAPSED